KEEKGKEREEQGKQTSKPTTVENGTKRGNDNISVNSKEGEEFQKPNERLLIGNGRKQRNVARQKEMVWNHKQAQHGKQIDTNNMFAALNDQEQTQEQLEKERSINQVERHNREEQST
ncbi:hypothetical protein HAX54_049347, partial [Datura stramonium]|nr:hypothetical protein [Datura stramonium]